MNSDKIEVKVGQIWLDNDPRCTGERPLRVDSIEGRFAICTDMRPHGRTRKIQIKRFRPTKTGYRLKAEVRS